MTKTLEKIFIQVWRQISQDSREKIIYNFFDEKNIFNVNFSMTFIKRKAIGNYDQMKRMNNFFEKKTAFF